MIFVDQIFDDIPILLFADVNFFNQWAKVSSHANKDTGGAAQIHIYKYADYLFTCPILVVNIRHIGPQLGAYHLFDIAM